MDKQPTARRRLIQALDRPGGRKALATIATRWGRRITGDKGIAVSYDGMWIDVVDDVHIPRGKPFDYYRSDFERMRHWASERTAASLDYWAHHYSPKMGDVIVDIGAGIGLDALSFSPLIGSTGQIYCLEAHPWTFNALLKTVNANRLTNVAPHHLAASDKCGTVWISDLPNNEENTVSRSRGNGHSTPVPSVDLDTFVSTNKIGRISLLKMNIEGAEKDALLGMSASIKQIDHIVVACHDFLGIKTKSTVIDFLRSHGFQTHTRDDDPRPYVRDHVHGSRLPSVHRP